MADEELGVYDPDEPQLPGGPQRYYCPCGCGAYGVISTRTGHIKRLCRCRGCLGGRSRRKGLAKQRVARKKLGIPDARYHTQLGNEENWRGYFRVEVKSGKQVGGLGPFFRAEKQSEANRAIGDARPFAFVAMPENAGQEGVVMVRLSAWRDHIAPLLNQEGSSE